MSKDTLIRSASSGSEQRGRKPEEKIAVETQEKDDKKKLPLFSQSRISLVERSRAKSANKHLIAGASRFHGTASIYRNDRPHEIEALVGVEWDCIISGEDHILAQDKQGILRSWGRGDGGQLGHEKFCHSGTPTAIETFQDCVISHVSCGAQFSAALTEDGQLFTWGLNDCGQLGHGNMKKMCFPTPVAAMFRLSSRHVAMMACGYAHMIVLTTARDVYTWGNNDFGQLGLGIEDDVCPTPQRVRIMSGLEIKQFGAGENHTCVLTSTGDIYSWGRGDYGQLGHGDQQHKDAPTLLKAFDQRSQPRKMSVGADFIFVLTYSGAVYSWGRNTFGQLGHGVPILHDSKFAKQPADEPSPRLVSFFSGDNDEVEEGDISLCSIACGTHHVMALSANRQVLYAWGRGEHGQLGLDFRDSRTKYLPLPRVVTRLKGYTISQIACGLNHTIVTAESEDKRPTILSWGRGSYGQLGHGSGKPVAPAYFKGTTISRPQSALENIEPSQSHHTARAMTAELRRTLSFVGDKAATVVSSPNRKTLLSPSSAEEAEKNASLRRVLEPVFSDGDTYSPADDNNSDFAASVLKQYMARPPYRKHDRDPDPLSTEKLLALVKNDDSHWQRDRNDSRQLPPRPLSTLGFERDRSAIAATMLSVSQIESRKDVPTRDESKNRDLISLSSHQKTPLRLSPYLKSSRNAESAVFVPRRPKTAMR